MEILRTAITLMRSVRNSQRNRMKAREVKRKGSGGTFTHGLPPPGERGFRPDAFFIYKQKTDSNRISSSRKKIWG
jgi:hypothetical protein